MTKKTKKLPHPDFDYERVHTSVLDAQARYWDAMPIRGLKWKLELLDDAAWELIEARDCINSDIRHIDQKMTAIREKIRAAKGGKK